MTWHDQAQQELDHIEAIIFQLEHLDSSQATAQASAVMQSEYWRRRIHAVLALPDAPRRAAQRGAALLARLDRIPNWSTEGFRRRQ